MGEEKEAKKICELSGSIGWVSFTPYQMQQVGIDPERHTTSDLREKVFAKLEIEARAPKKETPKKEEKKSEKKKA